MWAGNWLIKYEHFGDFRKMSLVLEVYMPWIYCVTDLIRTCHVMHCLSINLSSLLLWSQRISMWRNMTLSWRKLLQGCRVLWFMLQHVPSKHWDHFTCTVLLDSVVCNQYYNTMSITTSALIVLCTMIVRTDLLIVKCKIYLYENPPSCAILWKSGCK